MIMAKVIICDVCGELACGKYAENADAQNVAQIIRAVDFCEMHYDILTNTNWREYLLKLFGNSTEDGTYDKPYFFQLGMNVAKGLYYHIYGSEYSATKDMPSCQTYPGSGDGWQWVRQWTVD